MLSLFLHDKWRAKIAAEIALEDTIEELFRPFEPVDDSQLALEFVDFDAEVEELIDGRLDEEFWAHGGA